MPSRFFPVEGFFEAKTSYSFRTIGRTKLDLKITTLSERVDGEFIYKLSELSRADHLGYKSFR